MFAGFVGQFDYKLDGKGRIVIPSKFRDVFEDREESGLYVTRKTTDEVGSYPMDEERTFLQLFPAEEWNEMIQRLKEKARTDSRSEWLLRKKSWDTEFCELDSQYRINLPSRLIESASLESQVKFVGAMDCMELWNREVWREVNEVLNRQAPELEEELYDEN